MAAKLSKETLDNLAKYVKDFKCPQCKAFALYVKEHRKEPWVYCKKCAFSMKLSEFATRHMSYKVENGQATVQVPTPWGELESKVV